MAGRLQPDGSIAYPKRGGPPVPPYGYEAQAGDPYVLIPVFDPCVHRGLRLSTLPCGKIAGHPHCNLHNEDVKPEDCEVCDDREELISSIVESVVSSKEKEAQ